MLARLQRAIAVTLALVAISWAIVFAQLHQPIWAGAGAMLILFGYALFLGAEFLMLHWVQREGVAPRPTPAQLLKAWSGEVLTAPKVFLWRQPFRANAEADNVSTFGKSWCGVVFVHGFVCNRAFWNPWMSELRALGVPFIAVNLEPLFGSIDDYQKTIETAVAQMELVTGRPVVLVGHSMGGIAIRAWMSGHEAESHRIRRVITIGSPHHGTWLARFGQTKNGKQMRQHSPWLEKLAASEPRRRYSNFTCFFGHCDNIVFPAESGVLPGALNLHIPGTAHVHMAFDRTVYEEILRWVDDSGLGDRASPASMQSLPITEQQSAANQD
jgi:pimeloyl-ACP methyl ester carboxylesterase